MIYLYIMEGQVKHISILYINIHFYTFYKSGTAGSSLGYKNFCSMECNCPCNNSNNTQNNDIESCDPFNEDMELLHLWRFIMPNGIINLHKVCTQMRYL
jgi:hypothetical protein